MSGETRDGKCGNKGCDALRHDHLVDDEGLRMMCPDGSGRRFTWPIHPGRVSASFSRKEARALDILVAHAMGASEQVSKTSPILVALRRKTIAMRKKSEP